jgi:MerC mercury resistance protein
MKFNPSASDQKSLLNRADKIGSVLSSLCAVHCLCMPVVIGLLPVLGLSFLADHTFERAACVTMTLLAAGCLWAGCRIHRRWGLFILLVAGAALVLHTQFAGQTDEKETQTDWNEAAVMFAGGALIAVSHILNRRLRASCHCKQCCDAARNKTKAANQ